MIRLFKIRKIGGDINGDKYGITIPVQFISNWMNVRVEITQSGNALILTSGCLPEIFTKKEINNISEKVGVVKF